MAHFAQIGLNNIVKNVVVVSEDYFDDGSGNLSEENARNRLVKETGHLTWIQTSCNTRHGKYWDCDDVSIESTAKPPLRKNFAVIGGTYDADRDAFIPPKQFNSWVLDEDTCDWVPPIPDPHLEDGNWYDWDETTQSWVLWKTAAEYEEFIQTDPVTEDDSDA